MSDESCGIPTDVTFEIVENGQLHEVKAHRTVLGMISQTFKAKFSFKAMTMDVGDVMKIKLEDTSLVPFQIMISGIYNINSIQTSLEGKSLEEVFDVVNLIKRYQIEELTEAVKDHLANYPLTEDTVLEVATQAKEYMKVFEDEANQLIRACAKFLKSRLKDIDDVTRYAAENRDHGDVFSTLLAKMNKVQIFVHVNMKSKTISMEVDRNETIRNIQAKIKEGVNPDYQHLYYESHTYQNGKRITMRNRLRGEKTLLDYNIKDESTLILRGETGGMQIFCNTLTGRTITLVVKPSYSVERLKALIEKRTDIPADRTRLIFSGQLLDNGRILYDYNVRSESTIHLFLPLYSCRKCPVHDDEDKDGEDDDSESEDDKEGENDESEA